MKRRMFLATFVVALVLGVLLTCAPTVGAQEGEDWGSPMKGELEFTQGYNPGGGHWGVDLNCMEMSKTLILAVADGQIVKVYPESESLGYGNALFLKSGERYVLYAHFSKITVTQGENVAVGQVLGKCGSTGHSSGPHLHFGVRSDLSLIGGEGWTDPKPFIGKGEGIYTTQLSVSQVGWRQYLIALGVILVLVFVFDYIRTKFRLRELMKYIRLVELYKPGRRWKGWLVVETVLCIIIAFVRGGEVGSFIGHFGLITGLLWLVFLAEGWALRFVQHLVGKKARETVNKATDWIFGILVAFGLLPYLLVWVGVLVWILSLSSSIISPVSVALPEGSSSWEIPAGMQDLTEGQKATVRRLAPAVCQMTKEEDLPCEVPFVLWLKESGMRNQNPSNGEGLAGRHDAAEAGKEVYPPGSVSDAEVVRQLRLAARDFKGRYAYNLNYSSVDPKTIGEAYMRYNGNLSCFGMPFTSWHDHPYVMNGYDSAHMQMVARTSAARPGSCVKLSVIGAWPAHLRVAQVLREASAPASTPTQ